MFYINVQMYVFHQTTTIEDAHDIMGFVFTLEKFSSSKYLMRKKFMLMYFWKSLNFPNLLTMKIIYY